MSGFINVNGQKKKVSDIFVNVNGEKKSVSSAWVNRNGAPAKIFDKGGGQKVYVLATSYGLLYSLDLSNWIKTSITTYCSNVQYLNGYFITSYLATVGSYQYVKIAMSKNGISWTDVYTSDTRVLVTTQGANDIHFAYGNGVFVAVTNDSKSMRLLLISKDNGMTWTKITFPGSAYSNFTINDVFFDNGKFVLKIYKTFYVSDDGENWSTLYTLSYVSGYTFSNRNLIIGETDINGKVYASFYTAKNNGHIDYSSNILDSNSWQGIKYSNDATYGEEVRQLVFYNGKVYAYQYADRNSSKRGWKYSDDITKPWNDWSEIPENEFTISAIGSGLTPNRYYINSDEDMPAKVLNDEVFTVSYGGGVYLTKSTDFLNYQMLYKSENSSFTSSIKAIATN